MSDDVLQKNKSISKTPAIRVLLAVKQPLTEAGLTHLLTDDLNVRIVDVVNTRQELPTLLKKHQPHILFADYNVADYITENDFFHVRYISPGTEVLVISSDRNKKRILEVVRSGIKGYLTKDCEAQEVATAVQSIARGEKYFCQEVLDIIVEGSLHKESDPGEATASLTERETELLRLLAKGYSTQKASDEMNLSPHTVHSHRKKIIKKLHIKSPTEFVVHAVDLGLIDLSF